MSKNLPAHVQRAFDEGGSVEVNGHIVGTADEYSAHLKGAAVRGTAAATDQADQAPQQSTAERTKVLMRHTKDELMDKARELGIDSPDYRNKEEIAAAIVAAEGEPAEDEVEDGETDPDSEEEDK